MKKSYWQVHPPRNIFALPPMPDEATQVSTFFAIFAESWACHKSRGSEKAPSPSDGQPCRRRGNSGPTDRSDLRWPIIYARSARATIRCTNQWFFGTSIQSQRLTDCDANYVLARPTRLFSDFSEHRQRDVVTSPLTLLKSEYDAQKAFRDARRSGGIEQKLTHVFSDFWPHASSPSSSRCSLPADSSTNLHSLLDASANHRVADISAMENASQTWEVWFRRMERGALQLKFWRLRQVCRETSDDVIA